jgi:autotransporter-associated beta strand protein
MINLKNAETGKTTKTFKNPTSTRSPLNTLKSLSAFALVMLLGVNGVMGQTNPTPQSLPYTQNFSTFTGSTITYPSGIQGWTIAGSLSTSYVTTTPSGDFTLASGTNATTTAGVYDMNGKIGTISTGSTLRGICLSIVTTSTTNITLSYVAGTQAQTSGGRINEIGVQYRIGTTGTFTNISGSTYQNNATSTINTGTTASNTSTISVTLPSACENQSVVQLRWVIRDVSGGGSRPSFSVDDISVATATVPSIAISSGSIGAGSPNNGQTNVVLQRYDMAVTTANATLTGLTVTTAGTYASADLTNLKCWYQSSSTFNSATATLLSTKTTSLGAGSQVFPSFTSQAIASGSTGYIFVTADIASGATNGNTINIDQTAFSNITFSSGTKTGTDPVAAAGVQTITVAVPDIALSSPAASAANITVGTTNNVIYRFDLAITTATPSLTGVTINTSTGSNASGDLTNLKCWYQTSTTFNAGTATLLSTKTTSLAAGSQVFPAFSSQSLTTGSTYYIFITADVPLTATPNNTIIVSAITTSDLTFATGNKTGTANASGTKTIIDCTPADVTSAAASSANLSSVLTWVNPSCYDEILIVAATASNTGTPTGNGSAYTSNLSYGSGTALGNGFVVYKGSTSSQTVTGLTNGTQYFYKYFTRRGTTWSSGTEVSATPNIAGYYWNGASIVANPAAGGTGTWGTANSWRQPSSSGAQATWANSNNAVFAGIAGSVTLDADRIATAYYFNTTGYELANSSTRTLTGPIILGNNVGLTFSPNVNIVTPASGTLNIGSVSGSGTANIAINSAQSSATNIAQRINLAAASSSISVPINIVSAGGSGTVAVAGIVATSTGTSLTSAATITNNTAIKTMVGATSGNAITVNGVISGSGDLMFAAGASGGAGTITLGAANTYTGATIFNAANSGVIRLGIANALPTSTNVTFGYSSGNGGSLDLNGFNQTLASIINGGFGSSVNKIVNNGSTDATLTIDGSTSPTAFVFGIQDGTTNKISLVKAGSGTLILDGTTTTGGNTYTGLTTVSGGTLRLNRTGGTTIPITNNVTISGGTLKISTDQTLNNVTLTSGTLMVDAGVTLTINGSFTGGGTIENNGTIVLVGPSSFPGSGTTISAMNNLTIDRASNVTLDQSITITGNLTLTNGKLITGACDAATSNIALTMADNATITGASASRFVDGILKKTGNDAFTFPIGSDAKYAPVSLTAPSVVTDRFAVCYTGSNPNSSYSITAKAGSLNNVSKMEYWHINREAGASSANVTLSWDTIARSGPVRAMSDLRVCRWNGSQWDDLSNTGTTGSTASGTVTSGTVSSFSPFTLGSSGSANPLPVELLYFKALCQDLKKLIRWETASEIDNSHFIVAKSEDAINWTNIAKVNGHGNSPFPISYEYEDKSEVNGNYYRLYQEDFEGSGEYFKTIYFPKKDCQQRFNMYYDYESQMLRWTGTSQISDIKISITDLTGREVYQPKTIDLTYLPSGIYTIYAQFQEQSIVVKIKK